MKKSMRQRLSRIWALTLCIVLLLPPLAVPVGADTRVQSNSIKGADIATFDLLEETSELLTITKTSNKDAVVPGVELFHYYLTVKNNSDESLSNIIVSDIIHQDLLFFGYPQASTGTVTKDGNTVTWNIGTLAAYGSCTLDIAVLSSIDTEGGYPIYNVANATYKASDGVHTAQSENVQVYINHPEVTVTKEADTNAVIEGERITYTITVANTGEGRVLYGYLHDDLLNYSDVEIISYDGGVIWPGEYWRFAPLDVNQTKTLKYAYTVTPEDAKRGYVDNSAYVRGYYVAEISFLSNTSTSTVPVGGLDVKKTAEPTEAKAGDTVTYSVTVTNNGGNDLTGVQVTDGLLKAEFASAPSQGSVADGVWTIGDLANSDTATLTYTYTVTEADAAKGNIVNTATATGKNPAGYDIMDEDSATVTVSSPALKITKTADKEEVTVSEPITYTLTVENTGDLPLTDVQVEDDLLMDNIRVIEYDPPTDGVVDANGVWVIGELAKDATATLVYTYTTTEEGTVENTAVVTGKDPNGDTIEDQASILRHLKTRI